MPEPTRHLPQVRRTLERGTSAAERVRIMHIIGDLGVGGAQLTLLNLLEHMDMDRFEPTVISLTGIGAIGGRLSGLGVPVEALNLRADISSILALPKLIGWKRNICPHVIQTWMYHANLLGGLAGRLGNRVPVVWSIRHGALNTSLDAPSTLAVARIGAFLSALLPARIVCVSNSAYHFHAEFGYKKRKMSVIPNGIDVARFKPDYEAYRSFRETLGIGSESELVGNFGRYHVQKGQRDFLEGAALLVQSAEDMYFIMGGPGVDAENQELESWIEALNLSDRVFLVGYREDMPRVLAALDLLVMSSLVEAFPNVVAEAMACAVPCVVTEVGDAPEVVSETGLVIPIKDPGALAAAVNTHFSRGRDERIALGKAARDHIVRRYSMQAFVETYQEMYRDLAGINQV
jgi:glycosyltransferase involved in cell wall biosynthesis